MIFTLYKDKLFFLDILLHLLFSFIVLMVLFIVRFRKVKQQELVKKVKRVLITNVLLEITPASASDQTALKILNSIYLNEDTADKVTKKDIEKASYNQVIVFCMSIFVVIYFLDDKTSIGKLFMDKLITFVILGSTIYLYSYYFREKYSEISEKQIYDMLKKSNDKLKITTTY